MQNHLIPPRWGTYAVASRFSGLSTRLLEDLVKDELVISSLARRPGRSRGIRLIDLESLQNYIQSGIGGKTDMGALQRPSNEKGGSNA